MDINLFDYELPKELIAQHPSKERDKCRLMLINKDTHEVEDKLFSDIIDYLKPGDVIVRNNTKVNPYRLFGVKKDTGAHVEVLLLKDLGNDTFEAICGNAKVIKIGSEIIFKEGVLSATCLERKEEGIRILKFTYKGIFLEILNEIGLTPLPPYIEQNLDEESKNKEDYQTVYAKINGSSAAPTAGFHFTNELLEKIKEKGVEILDVTLSIGLGTFKPVKENDILNHKMHSESYIIDEETASKLNKAKKEGRNIIAIGTTVVRTLESNYSKYNEFKAEKADTAIFIYPEYEFKAIDSLVTNFHLPKSTLIMLVSALIGRDFTISCYNRAVENKYHFFSYGDAMFIYTNSK